MATGQLITRLDRYMFRQLAFALIAVTGGLTALIWLTQSLRFVELVVNHGLSLVRVPGADRPADPQLRRGDPADHLLRRRAVRLSAPRRRPRADGDARRRAVALRAVAPGARGGVACHGRRLCAQPLARAGQPAAFREFQWEIRNRMAAFLLQDGVFTPVSDDLTVYVRSRDTDGTLRGILVDDARDKNAPRDHPGRARPAGRRTQRPARRAVQRQPPADRPADRPARHADLQAECDRPGAGRPRTRARGRPT